MKSKKNTYLLLALVLGIWGMIGYQFFNFSNNSNDNVASQNTLLIAEVDYREPDTTLIDIEYRDPFSGELNVVVEKELVDNSGNSTNYYKEKEEIKEPIIKYKGIVSDLNDKVKIFMMIIDGNTYLMKQGEEEKDVKLIKGDRKTLTIKHKGELKTILIEE